MIRQILVPMVMEVVSSSVLLILMLTQESVAVQKAN